MDTLALLSNLYADGPVTLRRLRDAGCRSVDEVTCLDVAQLASILGATRESARRFQAEARTLLAREREVTPERPPDQSAAAEQEPEAIGAGEKPLRPGMLDGLDAQCCVGLRRHGVDSVEALVRCETLELSRALEIGVTRVMRLQFLARRLVEAAAVEEARRSGTITPPARPRAGGDRTVELKPAQPPRAPSGRFSPTETAFTATASELERELRRRHEGAAGAAGDDSLPSGGPFA